MTIQETLRLIVLISQFLAPSQPEGLFHLNQDLSHYPY